MQLPNRRTVLRSGLFSIAGMAGLPSLRAAAEQAANEYRRPKLKITDVRTAEVRVHGYQVHVRVYTDQGIVGQGESTDASSGNVPIIRSFARMLIGQDPLNIEAAFERIRTSGVFAGAQSGQYVTALTGVEIALWDIAGQAAGTPVLYRCYDSLAHGFAAFTGVVAGADAACREIAALTRELVRP